MTQTFEIRSKAFTIKWVDVPANCRVDWKIRPLKNSINLGIYQQRPESTTTTGGTGTNTTTTIPSAKFRQSIELIENLATDEVNQLPIRFFQPPPVTSTTSINASTTSLATSSNAGPTNGTTSAPGSSSTSTTTTTGTTTSATLEEKLDTHLVKYRWIGRCSADSVLSDNITSTTGGLYAFVFDNTFSKTKAKTVLFGHNIIANDANNVPEPKSLSREVKFDLKNNRRLKSKPTTRVITVSGIQYLEGFLMKRKRHGKHFNRRFFSLNLAYGILYYYSTDKSSVIRGNMMIVQTVVSADEAELMLYLDSGMEQWVLKADNEHEFTSWVKAFNYVKNEHRKLRERAGEMSDDVEGDGDVDEDGDVFYDFDNSGSELESVIDPREGRRSTNSHFATVADKIKSLKNMVGEMVKVRDEERLDSSIRSSNVSGSIRQRGGVESAPVTAPNSMKRKPSFLNRLKRKGSGTVVLTESSIGSTSTSTTTSAASSINSSRVNIGTSLETVLEKIVDLETEYEELVRCEGARSKTRSLSRRSLSRSTRALSIFSQEFYDAQEYNEEAADGVVMIAHDTSDVEASVGDVQTDDSSSSASEEEVESKIESDTAVVLESHDLTPLPYAGEYVPRSDIKPAACDPPSLISILRKGVGKDLSNMALPITLNEPLTFLQTYAETFEYCRLIDDALASPLSTGERIIKIGIFAISYLSCYKDKIRATRKPFNPLLGETYELVRPDLNIRLVTEKVVHKPFVLAAHVDSNEWSVDHTVCPTQKFYGKTAEIIMDGVLRLQCSNGDVYEWSQPTTTMRNVISITGEKYIEPSDSVVIKSNSGYKCVVSFVSENTRFSSNRSEKVEIKAFDSNGKQTQVSAKGAWTSQICLNNGDVVWKVNDELVGHKEKYGYTKFACSLNAMDEIHEFASPTDSRRRPDKLMYESGDVDGADVRKKQLEEEQRTRRNAKGKVGGEQKSLFFVHGSGNGDQLDWKFKNGDDGYWARRARGDWDGVMKLW